MFGAEVLAYDQSCLVTPEDGRGGVFAGGQFMEFDQANVREDVTHSFYEGSRPLHPFEGETIPVDPAKGKGQGKYSWAKSPRYDVPGQGHIPLEAGPLARRLAAARAMRSATSWPT